MHDMTMRMDPLLSYWLTPLAHQNAQDDATPSLME